MRELARLLEEGKTVAVVTDAGMPGISDPGVELVRAARAAGAAVDVPPGPSALLGALVLSGFDVGRFRFDGFPPRKPAARREYLESLAKDASVTVLYEAPTRVRALLADVAAIYPTRPVFALREYTKKFEEHLLGTARSILERLPETPRGEFVVVLDGANEADERRAGVPQRVAEALELLLRGGVRTRSAIDALVVATGLRKNDLYALAQSIGGRALDGRDRN